MSHKHPVGIDGFFVPAPTAEELCIAKLAAEQVAADNARVAAYLSALVAVGKEHGFSLRFYEYDSESGFIVDLRDEDNDKRLLNAEYGW